MLSRNISVASNDQCYICLYVHFSYYIFSSCFTDFKTFIPPVLTVLVEFPSLVIASGTSNANIQQQSPMELAFTYV